MEMAMTLFWVLCAFFMAPVVVAFVCYVLFLVFADVVIAICHVFEKIADWRRRKRMTKK